jgi:hypothetical protein
MNPYAFFVGCPRSGTTLLHRLGDAHPELAVAGENRWIARTFVARRGLTREGFVTPKLVERFRDPQRLEKLAIHERELERLIQDADGVPFASFVTSLYDRYGEQQGKRLVGERTPGYVRYLPTLHRLWPLAKFVHIVRDGRDVCLSVLDWRKAATNFSTFRNDPVTTTAVWWEWHVQLGLEGGNELGAGLYHELRYESLVAKPELECARLCGFLDLPYDDAMLRFHEGRVRDDPRLNAKHAWKPVTPGLRSWRVEMPLKDVVRFEAAAGDLLERLGYERAVLSIPRKELDRAARVRETFADEVRARERPLPRAWSNGTYGASRGSPAEAGGR